MFHVTTLPVGRQHSDTRDSLSAWNALICRIACALARAYLPHGVHAGARGSAATRLLGPSVASWLDSMPSADANPGPGLTGFYLTALRWTMAS
jgi:hypothetical protein